MLWASWNVDLDGSVALVVTIAIRSAVAIGMSVGVTVGIAIGRRRKVLWFAGWTHRER